MNEEQTNPGQSPSGRERREYYRITVTLPIRIQPETDETEGPLVEKAVNLSGGGIGVTITEVYQPNDVLAVTLRFPEHGLFTASVEVLRIDPIPYPGGTYRLHARFIRMPAKDQEVLIRHITRFQRDHLQSHYSA
jgi:c-di-GMP-binding flagellar brake protein YcgR